MRAALVVAIMSAWTGVGRCQGPSGVVRAPETQRRMAVLVGVDRYQDRAIARDLHGCRNDVLAMAEVLHAKFKFTPTVLVDHEATKSAVLQALQAVAEETGPDDQLVFFFSGYGSVDGDEKPTICPYDARADSAGGDIFAGELWNWVNAAGRKGASALLVLDCAFLEPAAIAMGPRIRPKCLARPTPPGPSAVAHVEAALQNVATAAGRGVIMTACRPGELAREVDRGENDWTGVFSQFCIEQLASQRDGRTITFQELREGMVEKISTYISGVFYGDGYSQTPSLYGRPEYLAQVTLFSTGEAVPAARKSNKLRLRLASYGGEGGEAQELRREFGRMPHIELVEQEESADQSLYVFHAESEVKAYLVDYTGGMVEAHFSAAAGEYDAFLQEVNRRVSGLIAFRWLASLPKGDDSFGLNLWLTDDRGEAASRVPVGDWVTVNLRAARECYVTVYSVTPEFECERVLPGPRNREDNYRLGTDEHWSKRVSPTQPDRYRLIAVAKSVKEQPSTEILTSFWGPLVEEYTEGPAGIAMGRGRGMTPAVTPGTSGEPPILPVPPSIGGATAMGATGEAGTYATDMEELTVTAAGL